MAMNEESRLEKELKYAHHNLFDGDVLKKLIPKEIKYFSDDEINPFSDYYGTLIFVEKILQNKKVYEQLFKENAQGDYAKIRTALLQNIFAPNCKTLYGRLNDRIKTILKEEGVLDFRRDVGLIAKTVSQSKRDIMKLGSLGTVSLQISEIKNEFEAYVKNALSFAEKVSQCAFLFRPRNILIDDNELSSLFETYFIPCYTNTRENVLNKQEGYSSSLQILEKLLSRINIKGDEANEGEFFYNEERYTSTNYFIQDWKAIHKSIERIREVNQNPYKKNVFFQLSALDLSFLKKKKKENKKNDKKSNPDEDRELSVKRKKKIETFFFIGATAGISTAAMLYFAPSWRYDLHLPTTSLERAEILYEKENYNDALKEIKRLEKEKKGELSFDEKYLEGKIKFSQLREKLDTEGNILERYRWAEKSLVDGTFDVFYDAFEKEDRKKDALQFAFSKGYLKWCKTMICQEDDSASVQSAIRSHLCQLQDSKRKSKEEENLLTLLLNEKSEFYYVSFTQEKNFYKGLVLAKKPDFFFPIEYTFEKKGAAYVLFDINFSDVFAKPDKKSYAEPIDIE